MIFIHTDQMNLVKKCKVVDVSHLHNGTEDGIVHVKEDNTTGNTIVSHFDKTDPNRYGAPLQDMIDAGWRPFIIC